MRLSCPQENAQKEFSFRTFTALFTAIEHSQSYTRFSWPNLAIPAHKYAGHVSLSCPSVRSHCVSQATVYSVASNDCRRLSPSTRLESAQLIGQLRKAVLRLGNPLLFHVLGPIKERSQGR